MLSKSLYVSKFLYCSSHQNKVLEKSRHTGPKKLSIRRLILNMQNTPLSPQPSLYLTLLRLLIDIQRRAHNLTQTLGSIRDLQLISYHAKIKCLEEDVIKILNEPSPRPQRCCPLDSQSEFCSWRWIWTIIVIYLL
jgi:hypothetical protein